MVHYICFSKDRPMQLQAHLDSLFFYSGINPDNVNIICKTLTPEYLELLKYYPCFWHFEDPLDEISVDPISFETLLNDVINDISYKYNDDDLILFSVDDLIYFRPFNVEILNELSNQNDVLGFSLRLGINTNQYDKRWNESSDRKFIKFDWRNKPSHFGYPFDVSSSAYRISLIKEILAANQGKFRIPNDLESLGMEYVTKNYVNKQPYTIMMNTSSYSSCLDFNRTQDIYKNPINGNENTTVENLLKLYQEGWRLDWTGYHNIFPSDPFIGGFGAFLKRNINNKEEKMIL